VDWVGYLPTRFRLKDLLDMNTHQNNHQTREQANKDEQARKATAAAKAGAETAVELREQAVENTRKSVQSNIDAVSNGFQRASDQFSRTLGFSGEEGARLANKAAQDVEAVQRGTIVLTKAFQDISRDWFGLVQRQTERNFGAFSALARCHTAQEFATVQSRIVREGLQQIMDDGRGIAEKSMKAIDEANKSVSGTVHRNLGEERTAEKRVA
jgi:hypothetical protein